MGDNTDKSAPVEGETHRKVEKGQPLTELVKGSLEYTAHSIRKAFRRQFPYSDDGPFFYVEEIFAQWVIVYSGDLAVDEYFLVTYEADDDGYDFAPRDEWEIVELAYRPATPANETDAEVAESETQGPKTKGKPKRLDERLDNAVRLEEAAKGKPRTIIAQLAQADVVNRNGRRYREAVLREAVEDVKTHLRESFSQGRAILLGEAEHPGDKRQGPRLLETVVVYEEIWFDEKDKWVKLRGRMVENTLGRDAIITMDAGVLPGLSLRGYGESQFVKESGAKVEDVLWLRLTGADLVLNPSFTDAAVTLFESLEENMSDKITDDKGQTTAAPAPVAPAPATPEELKKANPALYEKLLQEAADEAKAKAEADRKQKEVEAQATREKELRESLQIGPDEDITKVLAEREKRRVELEEAEATRTVAKHIAEKAAGVAYPEGIKESYVAYVQDKKPKTVEEANTALEEAKRVFDPLAADIRVQGMGMRGVQILGPVIENELGMPEFARPAYEIAESMRKRAGEDSWVSVEKRKARRDSVNERFTRQYLEKYDETYQHRLLQEAREYGEAMVTSQLSLPYQVLRAIIDEAYPTLIATSIFDVGVATASPLLVWYEANFTAETGYDVTVTDEAFTSDHDDWVALTGHHIDYGSVVITSNPAGTTYTEGTDYVIDYLEGSIMVLSAGTMANATSFLADFTYNAARKGENAGIERARTTLKSQTLTLTASRLATEISDETIKFSQSQLGFDAVARTLNLLVKELRKNLDANILHTALSQALRVANNSGGTWTNGTDPVNEFMEKIGMAKVLVENRNYMPTFVVMSGTNADRLANSDHFTAAGKRPDMDLDASGYVGMVKALPVFRSTQFTSNYVLVGNSQLIMFRTLGDMELKGPYPTYDTNRELVANDQYFVQEYNGWIGPIPQKGSYVKVA